MPKPYRMSSACPLPTNAEIVDSRGKPCVKTKERGRVVLYPLTKDGQKYLKPSKCWYFDIRDANGTVKRIKGFTDLKATEQLAAESERKASRVRVGIIDPAEEHAIRPLADHLTDYAAFLESKATTAKHIRETIARCSALFTGCGFVFFPDVDSGKASAWLAELRRPGKLVAIPPGDAFASSQVAKLLGITVDGVRRFVARHRLATVGNGPARRLTRAAVEFITQEQTKGVSPRTLNSYIVAAQSFFRWLVKSKRIGSDPLGTLSLVNTSVDIRRQRRELTIEELRALLTGTKASARTYRGLTGEDRFALYLVAAGTGFRSNAMANLTSANFDLNAATVTLAARFAKNRRTKVQPLPADVVESLREYLTGKPTNAPIWGGTWASGRTGAEMLRRDLEAVGIPYSVEGTNGPEYADFHSLRHTYLTMLGKNGVDLRTAQELAGHSTPLLTARYSHRRLHDLAGAVGKLPNLVPESSPNTERNTTDAPLRLSITEGPTAVVKTVVPAVVTGDIERHRFAPMYTSGIIGGPSEHLSQPLETQQPGAVQRRVASDGIAVGDLGFEPKLTESESVNVVPQHYGTKLVTSFDDTNCSARCSDTKPEGGHTDSGSPVVSLPAPPDLLQLLAALSPEQRVALAALLAPATNVPSSAKLDDRLPWEKGEQEGRRQ